jgi:hypothetical protein
LRAPGPLPPPSKDLDRGELPLVELKGPWFRTHPIDRLPVFYGTASTWRFDDPEGKYGVFYVAQDRNGAFIETFGQLLATVECPRRITSQQLSNKALSELVCDRPLKLVDLTGNGLARIGADSRIFAADHPDAQSWSKALHSHPSKVDGLLYPCRHDPKHQAAAIFDPSVKWIELSRRTWLSLGIVLRDILNEYNFALIETQLIQKALRKGPRNRSFSD